MAADGGGRLGLQRKRSGGEFLLSRESYEESILHWVRPQLRKLVRVGREGQTLHYIMQ